MLTLDFSAFPPLGTGRLLLRELRRSDGESLFRMRNDPRVMRHIGRPRSASVLEAIDFIDRLAVDRRTNTGITWAMTLRGDDTLIGTIGFYRLKPEHHLGEVGYMLAHDHWGRGLMSEALPTVLDCGFERFGFHRIEAVTSPGNLASRHVLEKNGFTLEGILRENYFWNGSFEDSCVFGLLQRGRPLSSK